MIQNSIAPHEKPLAIGATHPTVSFFSRDRDQLARTLECSCEESDTVHHTYSTIDSKIRYFNTALKSFFLAQSSGFRAPAIHSPECFVPVLRFDDSHCIQYLFR
jgi:hypothetical protein